MFVAETPDLIVDLVPNLSRLLQFFFGRAGKFRRIGERPMQARGHAGKNWTARRLRFIANRDDVGEQLPGLENIEDGLRSVPGNIDARFTEHVNRDGI